MRTITRRTCIAMGGLPVVAAAGAYAIGERELFARDARPRFAPVGPGSAREQIQQRHLPNVPLITHDGRRVRFYDDLVKNRKVALTFISTRSPHESRKVTQNLGALQGFFGRRVGDDIFLYSIARDPERDTHSVLAAWAARAGAGPGWKFLTGRPADVETLRHGLGFTSPNPAEDADPAFAVGLLRHGVEREMRWAHCQSQARPRVIAHSMLLDFGEGTADPSSPAYWRFQSGAAGGQPPIWNCERLLAGLD
jgi:protein SCO1